MEPQSADSRPGPGPAIPLPGGPRLFNEKEREAIRQIVREAIAEEAHVLAPQLGDRAEVSKNIWKRRLATGGLVVGSMAAGWGLSALWRRLFGKSTKDSTKIATGAPDGVPLPVRGSAAAGSFSARN